MFPKKLLYIGAGCHIQPVRHFPHTREFIFMDTQPRSEHDRENVFRSCFYRHRFYKRMVRMWSQYGFSLLSTTVLDKTYHTTLQMDSSYDDHIKPFYPHMNPTLLSFSNPVTNQTIRYYISTNINYNMCPVLQKEIEETEGLIVSGYFPNKVLLDHLPKFIPFYCYISTCYSHDPEDNGDTIIDSLYTRAFDYPFIIMEMDTGTQLHSCRSIHHVYSFLQNR